MPKPKDWGNHVEVAGFFFEPMAPPIALPTKSTPDKPIFASSSSVASDTSSHSANTSVAATIPSPQLPPELLDFLREGPPPVFVGFGSMVVDDALSLVQVLLEGAALVGVRIIFQSGWTAVSQVDFDIIAKRIEEKKLTRQNIADVSSSSSSTSRSQRNSRTSASSETNRKSSETTIASAKFVVSHPWQAKDALLIGSCSHDKLFPLVAAVIHHGGAGKRFALLIHTTCIMWVLTLFWAFLCGQERLRLAFEREDLL